MEFFFAIGRFIDEGGVWMYPILFIFVLGAAVAAERWLKLSKVKSNNMKLWNELQAHFEEGDFESSRKVAGESTTELGMVLSLGLSRQGSVRRRDDIEIAMEEGMMEVIPQLEKRTSFIALFANIATMLGLLGTIMGLIEAFGAVANLSAAAKAEALTASISTAMNTTAFGLIAGIPLLIFHSLITAKTSQIVDSFEMAQVKTLNVMTEFMRKQAIATAEQRN